MSTPAQKTLDKMNCWEAMGCGHGPGSNALCPAATETRLNGLHGGLNGGRACWAVDKTFCGQKTRQHNTVCSTICPTCKFYKQVRQEEGRHFKNAEDILQEWLRNKKGVQKIRARVLIPVLLSFGLLVASSIGILIGDGHAILHSSTDHHTLSSTSAALIFVSLVAGLALTTFFYCYLGRLQGKITTTHSRLLDEIIERQQAQEGERLARFQAEEATLSKSEFLAHMSHEIRTPMTSAIGMIDLAMHEPREEVRHEYLSMARSASTNMLDLLNDILDFSKIEAGMLVLEQTDFQLENVVGAVVDFLSFRAKDKEIELATRIHGLPAWLNGDPARLRQILLNLVSNAIKFTKSGRVTVICLPGEADDDQPPQDERLTLHCAVEDTGIGIPEEQQESIFDSFRQAENSTTREFGGTGLGLAITNHLVEMMDGRIWLESQVGMGTTFHFTARFGIGHPTEKSHTVEYVAPVGTPAADTQRLAGRKGLLVDDEYLNQRLVADVLKNHGCKVAMASNGHGALEKVAQESFDFIIMDIMMPEMDGIEACRRIRAEEAKACAHTPIIALTAKAFDEDRQEALAAGMDGYITKPFKTEQLLEAIVQVLPPPQEKEESGPADNETFSPTLSLLEGKIFDWQAAMEKLQSKEALSLAVQRFQEESPQKMASLLRANAQGDTEKLLSQLHLLKGLAQYAGASQAADTIFALEMQARRGTLEQGQEKIEHIQQQIDEFSKAVEEFDWQAVDEARPAESK